MTDREKILEMIAKASKLTEDAGAFKGEASAAAAKVQSLMEKYAISQMELQNFMADKQEKEFKLEFESEAAGNASKKGVEEWEWSLARLIARVTMTRNYSQGGRSYGARMVFFGVKENAKVAAELYELWHKNIYDMAKRAQTLNVQRILKLYKMKNPLKHYAMDYPEDDPKYFRASWITGCLRAMSDNVYEEEKKRAGVREEKSSPEQPSNSSALVLYKAEVDKAYKVLSSHFKKAKSHGSRGFSSNGYKQGQETGSKIRVGSKEIEG